MAKIAKPKKREPTVHSRAHRRNASPPPKNLAVTSTATEQESDYKPWLHNAQNAGVSKKKKPKQLSRQQKERQQKAMEKADANLDKLANKVQESKARGRKVQARRAEWEELNGAAKEGGREGEKVDAEEPEQTGLELDVGMAEGAQSDGQGEKEGLAAEAVALPEPEDDEEL